jgi:aspartate kinase
LSGHNLHDSIVFKFGGSVLDDERAIERASELVRETVEKGFRVVVVVSAMKGVTDNLLSLSKKVNPKMEPSLLDELLSVGERTSARLIAAALAAKELRPVVVDPGARQWPIITDDRHLDANPIMEMTQNKVNEQIVPLLEQGFVPVVCGFLGVTQDGRITTLGRGGSDTTAIVLGNCLSAKEVVLIKDVEGVFSSDPDRVSNPFFIESLNGEEAELLAAGGAKFLQLKALRYLTGGLKLRVTSLDRSDAGTVIESDLPETSVELSSQAVSMLTIVGVEGDRIESLQKLAAAINAAGGEIISLSLEGGSVIFYVSGGKGILDSVHRAIVEKRLAKAVSSFDGLSMIAVKGRALETQPGVIQRVTQPLARAGINLFGIVTIHSSIRVFVASEQSDKGLRLVREAMGVELN